MRFWLLLISVVPLVLSIGPVSAASQTDLANCQQMDDLDVSIAGCTKVVADPTVAPHDRAIAFFDRGVSYYAKNDLDNAIADWSEAIKLNPDYVHAYNNRAKAYRAKGDYEHAIADYSEAIKRDPHHAVAYKGRGIAYLLSGQTLKAEADFRQAATLDPGDQYAVLWLDIAARRNHHPSQIQQEAAKLDMSSWPAPLVFLFGGQMTPHDVAVAAQNIDKRITQARLCDAYFYIAESSLLKNDKDQATSLFQQAVKTCPQTVDEYSAAVAELKTMGQPVEAPETQESQQGPGPKGTDQPAQEAPGAKSP
jgi:lipoprotein NlpI